jgi:hypothetical protein
LNHEPREARHFYAKILLAKFPINGNLNPANETAIQHQP